jgi:hypothetical protein
MMFLRVIDQREQPVAGVTVEYQFNLDSVAIESVRSDNQGLIALSCYQSDCNVKRIAPPEGYEPFLWREQIEASQGLDKPVHWTFGDHDFARYGRGSPLVLRTRKVDQR